MHHILPPHLCAPLEAPPHQWRLPGHNVASTVAQALHSNQKECIHTHLLMLPLLLLIGTLR